MENTLSKNVIRYLNLSINQFEDCLNQICFGNNVYIKKKDKKNNGKELHYKLSDDSLIRVYLTKKGLTVDCTVCNNESLRQIVINKFENMLKNDIELVENKSYTYKNRTVDENENVIKNLKNCFNREEFEFTISQDNVKDIIMIKDRLSREKVTINIFKAGTIMIQGICYILWQDVTKVIEESLNNFSVAETLNRIMLKEEEIIERKFTEYENEIKNYLGEAAFDYLEQIDRTYLTSCCYLVSNKVILPEYSPIIMPLYKGLEGYFRKIIDNLGFYEETKKDKYWRIGHVFNREKETLKDIYKNKINDDVLISQLENLFKYIKERDAICHSGIPTYIYVDKFEDAVYFYEKVLNTIRSSYDVIKKFIK